MKFNKIKNFFIIVFVILLSGLMNSLILERISKTILIIYSISELFVSEKNKNKRLNFYLIVSLILTIIYGMYIELEPKALLLFIIDYFYIPTSAVYLLSNYRKMNNIKARTKLCLIITSIIFSIITIANTILTKELSIDIVTMILTLYPLVLSEFNNKKSIVNIILISLLTIAILISNFDILIFELPILLLINLIFNKKKSLLWNIILFLISVIYIIIFKNSLIDINFNANKSLFFIILEIILYYVPILYFLPKVMGDLKKNIRKQPEMFYYFLSVLLILILGIYKSNIYLNLIFPIISTMILVTYLNKRDALNKKIIKNKVTILSLHLGYGGIEQYLSSLCNMLNDDYVIEIISTYKLMEKPAFNFDETIEISYLIDEGPNKEEFKKALKNKNIIKIIKEGLKSIKILYQKKYLNIEKIENISSKYIITTRDFHNELMGNYARVDQIKIATEHNYHNDDKKYIKTIVNSVKNVNYFILVSETLRDFYSSRVNPTCIYIPNVIDTLPKKKSKCEKHNIISIGRLSKEKAQIDLIDVVKIIKEKYKDVKLYLIGDGEEKEKITNYINEHKLNKNVVLTGFLSKKDIELKVLDSQVFATTSLTESFGLVVIEASSYNLPIVAFDSAVGIKNLLKDDAGILVKNRNKKEMAKEIIKLFEDQKYKEKIAKNGYENSKKYLAKNVKKQWLEIIK